MKAKQIKINTGAACGTYVTEVRNDDDELLGFIRVVRVDFPGLGITTMFITKRCNEKLGYDTKLTHTLLEAYNFLNITIEELDKSELGDHPYDEYWMKRF